MFDKTRQIIKVDIATGDFVTPREIEYSFKLMFDNRTIRIMAYNLETVLAEKFETIISRGIANSRMRDFYDIYILTATQDYDANILRTALKNTAQKRKTERQIADSANVIEVVASNADMAVLWQRYQKKYSYASDINWAMVTVAMKKLVEILEPDCTLGLRGMFIDNPEM